MTTYCCRYGKRSIVQPSGERFIGYVCHLFHFATEYILKAGKSAVHNIRVIMSKLRYLTRSENSWSFLNVASVKSRHSRWILGYEIMKCYPILISAFAKLNKAKIPLHIAPLRNEERLWILLEMLGSLYPLCKASERIRELLCMLKFDIGVHFLQSLILSQLHYYSRKFRTASPGAGKRSPKTFRVSFVGAEVNSAN